jgi:exosortase/archaeosortase family protein
MGSETVLSSLQIGIARIVSSILNILGQKTEAIGTTVSSAQFSIAVVTACTGLFLTAVFLAAVLAYPARWLAKLLGAGIGLAGIFTLNIVRLVSLFFIGVYFPHYVDQAHLLIWQSLLIVSSLFLWLFWAGKVAHAAYKH